MRISVQSLLVCLLLTLSPLIAQAASAVSCHCFQDRQYEPTAPAAADPYFLATSQNSLLSVLYRIPKRDIVQSKMGGADGDLLWVIYAVADHYAVGSEQVTTIWNRLQDWRQVLAELDKSSMATVQAIPASADALKATVVFANALVRIVLTERLGVLPADIDRLLAAGANRKELLLSVLLADRLERSIETVWLASRNKKATWGSLLFEAEIAPKEIGAEWARLLKFERELKNAEH